MGTLGDVNSYDNKGPVGGATNPLTGAALARDRENQRAILELDGTQAFESITILDGSISPKRAEIIVDTEGGASADTLETILTNTDGSTTLHDGMKLTLRSADPSRSVTVKHSNSEFGIQMADGQDVTLSSKWGLKLKLISNKWFEDQGRSEVLASEALSEAKAVTNLVSTTPGAGKIPKADANGKINPRWYGTPSRLFASFNTAEPDGLLANGGAYSRTTYARLFAIIGTAFGAGDGSTTFNVPDYRGRTIQGAMSNLMAVLAAGLPNATGVIGDTSGTGPGVAISPDATASGALHTEWTSEAWGPQKVQNNVGYRNNKVTINLHDSNPIFGASSTVQSPAIAANIFIKY